MWWFVPWVIIIGFGVYFWLVDNEHSRSQRISDELRQELRSKHEG